MAMTVWAAERAAAERQACPVGGDRDGGGGGGGGGDETVDGDGYGSGKGGEEGELGTVDVIIWRCHCGS